MSVSRRSFVTIAMAATATAVAATGRPVHAALASGQDRGSGRLPAWPAARPITLIVPFAEGSEHDAMARLVGRLLGERLRQSVVVDNVPGAGGVLGVSKAVRSAADGYTLLMGFEGPVGIARLLSPSVRYDAERDLAPVGLVSAAPLVAVARPGLRARNLAELIALARARPGTLSYGTPGTGSVQHLAMEMLLERARIRMLHVPYRSGAQILSEVMGGQVDVGMLAASSAAPLLQHRKQATAPGQRVDAVAAVMRFGEVPELQGLEPSTWTGLFAPAATPPAVVDRLSAELAEVLKRTDVRRQIEDMGSTPGHGTPAAFADFLRREKASYAQIARSTGACCGESAAGL